MLWCHTCVWLWTGMQALACLDKANPRQPKRGRRDPPCIGTLYIQVSSRGPSSSLAYGRWGGAPASMLWHVPRRCPQGHQGHGSVRTQLLRGRACCTDATLRPLHPRRLAEVQPTVPKPTCHRLSKNFDRLLVASHRCSQGHRGESWIESGSWTSSDSSCSGYTTCTAVG